MGTAITTGIVRLSYAHIFEPAADLSGNIKYQATFLVPKSYTKTISDVEKAIEEAKQLVTVQDLQTVSLMARSATITTLLRRRQMRTARH